ncbi:DeoR/GlpR family DNA-binding transcription regulator [Rothia halotolerans]|uniref:DeoR/GlpR family DNA-binding transcription regulator n=1 Tax=Rothia halotolerans TaxID=405770 RepID=UPI00101C1141|nr:DeoR/GlpR family DNA-binding transcription regulator [Rothia halotolerans]
MNQQSHTVRRASERRADLMRTLAASGKIDAAAAAREMNVTTETVRKDLIALENQGRLRRVHGGAVPIEALTFEPEVEARTDYAEEKRRIAAAAVEFLPRTGSALMDAGSTVAVLAGLLPMDSALQFYVNALPTAQALLRLPEARVELLGGTLRRPTVATVGDSVTRALEEINVDVAFLGTNGISFERGLTTPQPDEAAVKRRMLASAERRILLADRSKIGLVRGAQHATLRDIDVLITDVGLDREQRRRLESFGITVVMA